ncbi:hypothetical protein [Aminivibrio sp.]|jgi:hypothetical protein|uniref:hypothetical protein n=1 Tax=Aminivibrio sp. TaxID=1872489 RepID=UPI001A4A3581|nr:hypothetical protein [Aminivibrio sp.]MBL3540499.1 hypothetical protein [Aminivibrio sp.]MDK2958400.1 hypothetical protein [Synergistaceae bacterium]
MAKKRPSLKNYLSTGEVFVGEETLSSSGKTEGKTVSGEGATAAEKAPSGKTGKTAGKKTAAAAGRTASPENKASAAAAKKSPGEKKTAGEKKTPALRSRTKKSSPAPEKPSEKKGEENLPGNIDSILEMLAPEDRPLWEKLFGAAETEFLPLDLVERREDFRTMPRDRFTLFLLEEPGKPLLHVRSSVRIREPLVCLIKWDETGLISVFR